jgi:hypothetical protein
MSGSNVTRMVERQMRNWELGRLHPATGPAPNVTDTIQFYITISREMGSQGEQVASQLARCLNWSKYDREILTYMSENEDVRRRLYESLDERQRGWLQQLVDLFEPMGIDATRMRDEYFGRMCQSIMAIAQHQHAVFVGRGASFILPPSRGLSVRIVAPLEYRIANVMQTEGLSQREARRRIYEIDARRTEFLLMHFGPRPYDPRRYDMVLNAGKIPIADIVYLIRQAAERKSKQPLPCKKPLV